MTHTKFLGIAILVAAALLCGTFIVFLNLKQAEAGAFSGGYATQYTATTTVVGPQSVTTLFAATGGCTSRVIGTKDTAIYILFADQLRGGADTDVASTSASFTETGAGFTQAASTTVVYDGELYGCGRMQARTGASTTISVAQFR